MNQPSHDYARKQRQIAYQPPPIRPAEHGNAELAIAFLGSLEQQALAVLELAGELRPLVEIAISRLQGDLEKKRGALADFEAGSGSMAEAKAELSAVIVDVERARAEVDAGSPDGKRCLKLRDELEMALGRQRFWQRAVEGGNRKGNAHLAKATESATRRLHAEARRIVVSAYNEWVRDTAVNEFTMAARIAAMFTGSSEAEKAMAAVVLLHELNSFEVPKGRAIADFRTRFEQALVSR